MIIGIPSYRRAGNVKTLETLKRYGVPLDCVTISTQTTGDYDEYHRWLASEYPEVNLIYREAHNAAGNRNTLLMNFEKGAQVLLLEDDVKKIVKRSFNPTTGNPCAVEIDGVKELEYIARVGFQLAKRHKTRVFGVNLNANALYLRPGYHHRKIYNIACSGIVNDGTLFDEKMDLLDDTEMCLRQIRLTNACISIEGYGSVNERVAPGGCFELWTGGKKEIYVNILKEMYPDIVDVKMESGNSIRLKDMSKYKAYHKAFTR